MSAELQVPAFDRMQLLQSHPVLTRKFQFATPPLKRAIQTATHLIASGAPHGVWIAPPRFGKTCATEFIIRCLDEAFPNIPMYLYIAKSSQVPKEREFFVDFLYQLGSGPIEKRASSLECMHKLVRLMFTDARSRGSETVLLIGDEMQKFTEYKWSWLADIKNELERLGVRLIVIVFGQLQLWNVRSALHAQQRDDLLARFLLRAYSFEGIRSSEELCEVMQAYDDPNIRDYPAGSGVCFTEFFFPIAYQSGWRLASQAYAAWEQFEAAAKHSLTHSQVDSLNVGMEWISAAIQHMLTHRMEFDAKHFSLRNKDWKEAVAMSGFENAMALIYDAKSWGK